MKSKSNRRPLRRVGSSAWLGATVRLRKGKRTAIVISDNVTISNRQVEGGVRLDKPLAGFRYWNIADLVMVAERRSETPPTSGVRKP